MTYSEKLLDVFLNFCTTTLELSGSSFNFIILMNQDYKTKPARIRKL